MLPKISLQYILNTTDISNNLIENAICKYNNHPNVIAITKYMKGANSTFSVQTVAKENTTELSKN